ncbi:nucleotidyltransferase domain-containing protein [Cryptosporangium arvum]|uniref:Uncharacterized protein n=1 Tax=Cryptosporangium arvum DSM 44712 TaxID=927661 RepID=A0A010Z3R7_9ACTN|nr:hypothetical protein CryarDRAFT_3170 [Cryptosporangium arvum DSM 44712]
MGARGRRPTSQSGRPGVPWYVAGGWAVDLFPGGQPHEHEDLEIAVPSDGSRQSGMRSTYRFEAIGDGRARPIDDPAFEHTYQTWLRERETGIYRAGRSGRRVAHPGIRAGQANRDAHCDERSRGQHRRRRARRGKRRPSSPVDSASCATAPRWRPAPTRYCRDPGRACAGDAQVRELTGRTRMTSEEIYALVSALGGSRRILIDPDPIDRAQVYRSLNLDLTHHPSRRTVTAEARPEGHVLMSCVRGPT